MEQLYGDVVAVWEPWTTTVQGHTIDSGHHMAEDAPDALANALLNFWASPDGTSADGARPAPEDQDG